MSSHNKEALQLEDIHLCQDQPNQACLLNLPKDIFHLSLANPKKNKILLFKQTCDASFYLHEQDTLATTSIPHKAA